MNHRRFAAEKKGIGHLRDSFTRKHLRDVGQDEKGGELTQQKCKRDERASGLSRRMKERKKRKE